MLPILLELSMPPSLTPRILLDLLSLTEGNDPPLDSEIPLIRQIISEEVARIAALDAQMRGLEDTSTELVAK
jgi:hypothetical protein